MLRLHMDGSKMLGRKAHRHATAWSDVRTRQRCLLAGNAFADHVNLKADFLGNLDGGAHRFANE